MYGYSDSGKLETWFGNIHSRMIYSVLPPLQPNRHGLQSTIICSEKAGSCVAPGTGWLKCCMISMAPALAKAQHEPHVPWSLIGHEGCPANQSKPPLDWTPPKSQSLRQEVPHCVVPTQEQAEGSVTVVEPPPFFPPPPPLPPPPPSLPLLVGLAVSFLEAVSACLSKRTISLGSSRGP